MLRTLVRVMVVAVALLAVFGCKPEQETLVVGDSITWQVVMSGQWPDDLVDHTMFGWRVDHVQPKVTEMAKAGTLGELVVALGTNDSNPAGGGWTNQDIRNWNTLLDTPNSSTPIVVVLPWLTESASWSHRVEINKARTWMATVAADRENVTVVDWRDYIGPNVLGSDGVHLAQQGPHVYPVTPEAVDARLDVIRAGMS